MLSASEVEHFTWGAIRIAYLYLYPLTDHSTRSTSRDRSSWQSLWHCRRPTAEIAVCAERSGTIGDWNSAIRPIVKSLHWLPVCQRVTFKLATLVHKCQNAVSGHVPVYLADDCQQVPVVKQDRQLQRLWMCRERQPYLATERLVSLGCLYRT